MGNEKMMASRDKLWTDRDYIEKIEALRHQVVYLSIHVDDLCSAIEKLSVHEHNHAGQVLTRLDVSDARDPIGYRRNPIPLALRDNE